MPRLSSSDAQAGLNDRSAAFGKMSEVKHGPGFPAILDTHADANAPASRRDDSNYHSSSPFEEINDEVRGSKVVSIVQGERS